MRPLNHHHQRLSTTHPRLVILKMETLGEGNDSHAPVDLEKISAIIALAANAMAAAAEALAEAAKEMSNASGTFDDIDLVKDYSGVANLDDTCEQPHSTNGLETSNKSTLSKADDRAPINHANEPQFGPGVPAASSPPRTVISISSNSSSEVELVPLHSTPSEQPSGPSLPQHEITNDSSEQHDTPEPQLNNKLDALPPSPVTSTSNVPTVVPTVVPTPSLDAGLASGPQSDPPNLPETIIPPGRNYIRLIRPSDALAFIAYMALQANRIIFIVPDHLLGGYAKL
ncbi:hypothetical protein FRC11_000404, partial [Ceratobasidium sp. 423]